MYQPLIGMAVPPQAAVKGIDDAKTCCICKLSFAGWGNNPAPWAGSTCCRDCNRTFVIPARIARIRGPLNVE